MLDMDKCWTEQPLVVVDTETCGLNPGDGICDIAALRFERGEVVASFSSYINPGKPIPEAATAIHGIRDEHVAAAPSLLSVSGNLLEMGLGAVPCAYSAAFDRQHIQHEIYGSDCPLFDPGFSEWLDVLVIVREKDRYVSGKKRHTLGEASARRGIIVGEAHRARPDALATGLLLWEMLRRGEVRPCPIGKLLAYIGKCKREQEERFQEWLAKQPAKESV